MRALATWEATPTYDPYNPGQYKREQFAAIPGSYASWYWNPVKTTSTLGGSLGAGLSSQPRWVQALVVGSAAAAVGFIGVKFAAPQLRARGILKGAGRRYRR